MEKKQMINDNIIKEDFTPLLKLWWAFFGYAAIVAFTVQLVLLPYVFPGWHAGNGLLVGGDWLYYHSLAVELAQKIYIQGWSVWELRPEMQAPAGIAGAIYALTTPQPWTVIPVNAALHATAGLVLLRIIQVFVPNWRRAIWAVLPFLLYPSAMTWYTQILKDGYSLAGTFLFIYGWVSLAQAETWERDWLLPLRKTLWVILGVIFVWVVRPYGVEMMQGVGAVLSLLLTGVFLTRGARGGLPWRKAIAGSLMVWMLIIVMTPLTWGGISAEKPQNWNTAEAPPSENSTEASPSENSTEASPSENSTEASPSENSTEAPPSENSTETPPSGNGVEVPQEASSHTFSRLLSLLDSKIYTLAVVREGFITGYPNAGSTIDVNVVFRSVSDVITYLPRAMQIAFLAPFPNQWFEQGSLEANTMMRRISALEMMVVYFALAFLPYALWHWRRRLEIWLIIAFSSGMMLIYGLVVPNIGTLYRWRYGYIMMLVALGIAGCIIVWQKLRAGRQDKVSSIQISANKQRFDI
ncbi:MAG: hypothetical protein ACYDG6_08635 [Thermincolia bacterium]